MVSQGYWLRSPGHDWSRVRLEDYLTAAGNAGLYAQPALDGAEILPPRSFVDVKTGLTGTTEDPNIQPEVGPPPPLTPEQIQQAEAALATVYQMLEFMARQLLSLGKHLEQIAQVYQPTKAGDGSRT